MQKGAARRGGKSTSEVGALAELAVANALTTAGLDVYVPFFNAHSRVDLIYVNRLGEVRRVQCKSAFKDGDVVKFSTCSHTGGVSRSYNGDVDEFGVFCPELNVVYVVPVVEAPERLAHLRVTPTSNNQSRGIRWASD